MRVFAFCSSLLLHLLLRFVFFIFFFFKQKTAYDMRISDWSSDVCSSDLSAPLALDEVSPPGASRGAARAAAISEQLVPLLSAEIGRASCRERVCQYV